MRRFFYNLIGKNQVIDKCGSLHEGPADAFRSAERLAKEIAGVQPGLCGTTSVVMTEQGHPEDCYVASIGTDELNVVRRGL